jgi:hypothetical protein
MLVVALGIGIGLLATAWSRSTGGAKLAVSAPVPQECPTGEGAPACFRFEITNVGTEPSQVTCSVRSSDGLLASFLNDDPTYSSGNQLDPGTSVSVVTKVVPAGAVDVRAPRVECEPA